MTGSLPYFHINNLAGFLYYCRKILHDQERRLAIQDKIIDHAAVRPLMIPRIAVSVKRDDIDLRLLLKLMQRDCRIFAGDEVSLNSNAF
jgi:hypothetical protein